MDIGTIVRFTDRAYTRMGWLYGRVEGCHWYDQTVIDVRKLNRDENTDGFHPTGTMIYMVPGFSVEPIG